MLALDEFWKPLEKLLERLERLGLCLRQCRTSGEAPDQVGLVFLANVNLGHILAQDFVVVSEIQICLTMSQDDIEQLSILELLDDIHVTVDELIGGEEKYSLVACGLSAVRVDRDFRGDDHVNVHQRVPLCSFFTQLSLRAVRAQLDRHYPGSPFIFWMVRPRRH